MPILSAFLLGLTVAPLFGETVLFSLDREIAVTAKGGGVGRTIALDPDWRVLRLTGEIKVEEIAETGVSWQNGRFALRWTDEKGKTVTPWPNNVGYAGTTDWIAVDQRYVIPAGAKKIEMSLGNLAGSGTAHFRGVKLVLARTFAATRANAPLPEGVTGDVESLDGAWKVETPMRLRYSMNGLWRVRPVLSGEPADVPPSANDAWSWARVPDLWSSSRTFGAAVSAPYFEDHPDEAKRILPDCAWYARTFEMPSAAKDRAVFISFDNVASRAVAFLDGRRLGEVVFPGGEIDLTPAVVPGRKQTLAFLVTATADGETLNYNEATRANREKKVVKYKGLTSDLWLDVAPRGPRIAEAWTETSVEKGEITFVAEAEELPKGPCTMEAEVSLSDGSGTRRFAGAARIAGSHISFTAPWSDAKLWDTDTPENLYTCRLTLRGGDGAVLDAAVPFTFGFREIKVVGRDLYLNGRRLHLRSLFDQTFERPSSSCSRPMAAAKCRNVMRAGFNHMIAGNYSTLAGAMTYQTGMLEACDETGMLYSFNMPHFKDFGDLDKPENLAAYRRTAKGFLRLARNHPSVILWAGSHNSAGYLGAGNPRRIDGLYELPASQNGRNRAFARKVREVIRELDPTRPMYHHESGNLDDFHTVNCYLDWAPIQERSDWLEHWSTVGVKPLFFVEWGLPHISTWSSYRGPLFIWRGRGYMSLWSSEYAAAIRGDAAYETTTGARAALDLEERLWARGEPFHWSQLCGGARSVSNNYVGVQAAFADDNWRSFRGWGISAMLPWDWESFFAPTGRIVRAQPPDLYAKTPGWKTQQGPQWADPVAYAPSATGRVMLRWNQPECAWIGGEGVFTTKRHNYRPGEKVTKTLVIVNDRRRAADVAWRFVAPDRTRSGTVRVGPGDQARVPVAFTAPDKAGPCTLAATFDFGGKVLEDSFTIDVIASTPTPPTTPSTSQPSQPSQLLNSSTLLAYDPKGQTLANLKRLGFGVQPLADLSAFNPWSADVKTRLVIGREALTAEILREKLVPFAKRGGRVFVFEQTKETLESIGFRVQEYLLRHAFARFVKPRTKDAVRTDVLHDWAGESTLVEPFDPLKEIETGAGRNQTWAGFSNTRVWRCGNRGAVASVIPEKPSYGDWSALVDGGFDLQYAPLLEWRLGGGFIDFCQLDVTGRTVADPGADEIVKAMIVAAADATPRESIARPYGMHAYQVGGFQPRERWFLEQDEKKVYRNRRFLVTGGAGMPPENFRREIAEGATAVLCGLSAAEVKAWCPVKVTVEDVKGRHFTRIEKLPPELNGLSNADWAWHGKMDFAAFTGPEGEGNEAVRVIRYGKGALVFLQVPPWKFDTDARPYLRTSRRRAECLLSRVMGNLGFRRGPDRILYADQPQPDDDPYRYYHW